MSLLETIKQDRQRARLARDGVTRDLLGTVIQKIEAGETAFKTGKRSLTETEIIAILKSTLKDLDFVKTSLAAAPDGRDEQIATNVTERNVIQNLLPKQLDESELSFIIQAEVDRGLSFKDIMVVLRTDHSGLYDGKMASDVAKKLTNP